MYCFGSFKVVIITEIVPNPLIGIIVAGLKSGVR
jgi:hypothetical protein